MGVTSKGRFRPALTGQPAGLYLVEAPRWPRRQTPKEAPMPQLTDAQLVILSAAAGRKDQAVLPLPKSLKIKGTTVTNILYSLRKKGLLEEKPTARGAVGWRDDKDGRRKMLVITEAGFAALDGAPKIEPSKRAASAKSQTKKVRIGAEPKKVTIKTNSAASAPTIRVGTKQALLIGLMQRKTGATLDEAVEATGWQRHSVRGAISGTLKKKLGLAVASEKVDGRGRVYRIAGQD